MGTPPTSSASSLSSTRSAARPAESVSEARGTPTAKKSAVLKLLNVRSRNHLGLERYEELVRAAKSTLALPRAQVALWQELPLIISRIELFTTQLAELRARMTAALNKTPEGARLVTIPDVNAVMAATFLGSISDLRAYESSAQVLKIAGLSLVERSSRLLKGKDRISQRGPGAATAALPLRAAGRAHGRDLSRRVPDAPREEWREEDFRPDGDQP